MNSDKSVLLLHDQLLDARVWVEVESLVASHATVLTVSPPPLHSLGPPSAWAAHVAHHAREVISSGASGGVDLAVTIGGAAEAGIELATDRQARAVLLIDPDLTPLAGNNSTHELLREEDFGTKLEQFFQRLEPHLEGFAATGTLSEEGISTLVAATFENDQDLPHHHRELLRQMMTEQLRAMLPLNIEAQQRDPPERPDWIARLAPIAGRCTIATSPDRLGQLLDLEAVLCRRAPSVSIASLTLSRSSLLSHPPHEISGLILGLLRR